MFLALQLAAPSRAAKVRTLPADFDELAISNSSANKDFASPSLHKILAAISEGLSR